jgi:hypothetical protein
VSVVSPECGETAQLISQDVSLIQLGLLNSLLSGFIEARRHAAAQPKIHILIQLLHKVGNI